MVLRPARRIAEFVMVALCLWAGAYHTPAGALVRSAGSWLMGMKTSAQPLLSYYGGAGAGAAQAWKLDARPPESLGRGELTSEVALGYGAYASLMQLEAKRRQPARELARRFGQERQLEDPRTGPKAATELLHHLTATLGSEEAAVLALMCGDEPARYAQERARAEGGVPSFERLMRQLPPNFEEQSQRAGQALALGVAYGLTWPVSSRGISSPFGMRQHPVLGEPRMHTGVDIPLPEGTPVHAAAGGVVRRASQDAVNGRVLVIDHGYGVTTAYCHNEALAASAGQPVARGEMISRSGNTGRSTGPHLHFQLELGGEPVDPLRFRPGRATVAEGAPR